MADGNANAVLWDMDGVLADTAELHYHTWKEIMVEYDIALDRDVFISIFGMNNAQGVPLMMGRPVDDALVDDISRRKETRFRHNLRGRLQTLPGVREWLARLRELGFRQAVASSAPMENIQAVVDELQLRPYFDAIVSADGYPGKPDPAVFLNAAEALRTPTSLCTVIEDSVPGVEAAKRAGMRCVAVTNSSPAEALTRADLVVNSLEVLRPEDFRPAA